jgi:hypothetical protein
LTLFKVGASREDADHHRILLLLLCRQDAWSCTAGCELVKRVLHSCNATKYCKVQLTVRVLHVRGADGKRCCGIICCATVQLALQLCDAADNLRCKRFVQRGGGGGGGERERRRRRRRRVSGDAPP